MKMTETKVTMSEELAIKEIERWAEENDIDLYVTAQDGSRILDAGVSKLVKAIQSGLLVVTDDGVFEYTISDMSPEGFAGTKIVLKSPTGTAYMAMDSFKEHQGVHKNLALASAITGKDVSWFGRISNKDYKVVTIIVAFFIAG